MCFLCVLFPVTCTFFASIFLRCWVEEPSSLYYYVIGSETKRLWLSFHSDNVCVFFFFLLSSTNLPWNHCLRKELFIFGTLSMLWQRTIIADGFALLGFDWGLCYYLTLNTILKEKGFFFFYISVWEIVLQEAVYNCSFTWQRTQSTLDCLWLPQCISAKE